MKREIRSTLSVAHLNPSLAMSISNAVRFIFAQLFFGFFVFTPTPI